MKPLIIEAAIKLGLTTDEARAVVASELRGLLAEGIRPQVALKVIKVRYGL